MNKKIDELKQKKIPVNELFDDIKARIPRTIVLLKKAKEEMKNANK